MRLFPATFAFIVLFSTPSVFAQGENPDLIYSDSFERCRDIGEILPVACLS